ncbi:MAG: DUF4189 domain-containing protein [Sphingopyxis sp.]|nr:DUF4189 domain-containing protein [Sphingopyxis sp.]
MIRFSVLAGLFVAALLLFAAPQPARAAYPCPGGPGPGEVQVGVSGGSHGVAAVPVCERSGGGGGDGGGGGVYYAFGSVAFHADADDVWMAGNWNNADTARREALAACNRDMGGGCASIGDWNNSSMTIIRDSQGGLWNGWNGQGGASRKRVLAECSSKQLLPCEILHSFGADKRRYSPRPTARKLYASAAWVYGEGYDGRLYIASGHRSVGAANDAALAACAAASASRCRIAAGVGNGVIQPFKSNSDTNVVAERTAKRGAEAAQADCKRRAGKCQIQRAYDSRIPGAFVHDFNAAAAK